MSECITCEHKPKTVMASFLIWLKEHWQILMFMMGIIGTGGMVYGEMSTKVATLEEAVKSQAELNKEIYQLREQSARIDERTKSILEMMSRMERTQQKMVIGQR